ncbi:uncharacterized protein LOC125941284 [Dermacentor silvarum]|uniref:uncharacterized protein LOC125941284 n=1 Tax=Dermacentor silvarum TaxID=543639 RepID=UPI0021014C1E|nr:uncharacterized protein LOC125941284 [Dermacentor silvarum]
MDAHNKSADESSTGAAAADTTTSAAGTKPHTKHKSSDRKRQRPQSIDEKSKSPDSAVSNTETSTKTSKRPKKSREPRDDGGARDAQKTPEGVAAAPEAQEKPQPELRLPALPSTCTEHILLRLVAQQAPAFDRPPPTRLRLRLRKMALPYRPLKRGNLTTLLTLSTISPPLSSVLLAGVVASIVIVVVLALALVGIIFGMVVPAAEHGCPPLDKPLAEGNVMLATKGGRLVGSTVTVDGVALSRFLGIPFAQSTVGDRRFAVPLPLAEPGEKCAVREYVEPRPPCAQWNNGRVLGSEDCLHVNVWTPAATVGDNARGGGRALVVAVSGEWFDTGSNDDPDWPKLAAKGDVVVVAPNHRHGVLGFLHPSSVVGVAEDGAVADVVSGVLWARDHADSFGADPKQLVLVGRGSGAYLLSAAARNLSKDTARRAFYHGIVYGSMLPLDPATPYQHLASALNCSDADKSTSAWVSCFRAAPVEELLKAAQTPSHMPLKFAPHFDLSAVLKPDTSTTPQTVIAGADAADDKAFFKERILLPAQLRGNASTLRALKDYMLDVFNVPSFQRRFIKSRFNVFTVDDIAEEFSIWVSMCATLKRATAVDLGYHYRFESAVASGLLRPPLGIDQVAQFAAHGTVPPLADRSPWRPLRNVSKTRVVIDYGHESHEWLADYNIQCTII